MTPYEKNLLNSLEQSTSKVDTNKLYRMLSDYNLAEEFVVFTPNAIKKALLQYSSHPRQMNTWQRFDYLWEKCNFHSNPRLVLPRPKMFRYESEYYSERIQTYDSPERYKFMED